VDGVARNLSNVVGHLQTAQRLRTRRGPSGFSRSVTRKRNESPIFRKTNAQGSRSSTEVQCGSLTRLLITISRTMSSIDRKSGRPCGGKYKSPMSETMRCDIRDCETKRTADSPTRLAPSILIRPSLPVLLSSAFFHFFISFGRIKGDKTCGKTKKEGDRKMKKSLVINSGIPIKNVQVGICSFFSAWI